MINFSQYFDCTLIQNMKKKPHNMLNLKICKLIKYCKISHIDSRKSIYQI